MPPPPEVVPVMDPPLAVLSQDSQKQAPLMRSWSSPTILKNGDNQESHTEKSHIETVNLEEDKHVEITEDSSSGKKDEENSRGENWLTPAKVSRSPEKVKERNFDQDSILSSSRFALLRSDEEEGEILQPDATTNVNEAPSQAPIQQKQEIQIKATSTRPSLPRTSKDNHKLTGEFWGEAEILSKLHHPNVVAFYGVVKDGPGGTLATVTEYMVDGSLRHVLVRKDRHLDRRKRLIIAMDAAFGMEYLHAKNIVHFDLKCDNLLVNLKDPSRPICKVGDFGLSKIKRNTLVSGGVDVFSFGIVLWEILTHPNVVAFYGVVKDGPGGTLATVTEYMVDGSLRHVLVRKDRHLDRRKRLIIAMDAAFGMEYLHAKNIVHFDLKCDNLLVNLKDPSRPICKVGDFGLSKIKRNTLVSGGVDVFSFGIVLWEILTGEEPYANMHYGAIIGYVLLDSVVVFPKWKK
ncbi:hypothetical protein F2Q68_00013507 [Brassica cretica]|uniref:Protein kinase domain-containing protein n=1 Tax=Brassica cretica TaxID=69181 RepID=A0A8S9HZ07_BRACR|nr:hypothetical protein F2Q68_00013507 [Brassica cretica]